MSGRGTPQHPSRRSFLAAAGGVVAAASTLRAEEKPTANNGPTPGSAIPFHGNQQAGIVTPQQCHTYFCALDVRATKIDDLVALLRVWTEASARLAAGLPAVQLASDVALPAGDSGDVLDINPSRLTLTFGFGPGLFEKNGQDRFGLARHRPEALVDLPKFHGDQMIAGRTGGDISIQACADDPQVAFHAIRQLTRLAYDAADIAWVQAGFVAAVQPGITPRNLMGFKDGTRNPGLHPTARRSLKPGEPGFDETVWAGPEGPDWMQGGSYMVARRIRMSLEHWDRTPVDFQEEVIGRHKLSGAPIGAKSEFDAPDFDAADADGNPNITETAHLRQAAPETNEGARIFRRGYNYNDGVNFTAERWPPWHQGMQYDAGLFFIAYQRDPRTGFIRLFENMAKFDALNQYTTHVGGGLFACPPGAQAGEYIGQKLFDSV